MAGPILSRRARGRRRSRFRRPSPGISFLKNWSRPDLGNCVFGKYSRNSGPKRTPIKPLGRCCGLCDWDNLFVERAPSVPLKDGKPALPRRGKSTTYTAKPRRRKIVWYPSRSSGVDSQKLPVLFAPVNHDEGKSSGVLRIWYCTYIWSIGKLCPSSEVLRTVGSNCPGAVTSVPPTKKLPCSAMVIGPP